MTGVCTQSFQACTTPWASREPQGIRSADKDWLYHAYLQQLIGTGQEANIEVHSEMDSCGSYRLRFYALSDIMSGQEILLSFVR